MSIPNNNSADITDFPSPSDDDVHLLHAIITTAESDPVSSTHPLRALFSAYYEVLAVNDLDPNKDKFYLRFLLRMRDGTHQQINGQTESLLTSFTTFLQRLGVHVVFDEEQSTTSDGARDHGTEEQSEVLSESSAQRPRRRSLARRSSHMDLQDATTSRRSDRPMLDHDLPPRPLSQNTLLEDSRIRDPLYTTFERPASPRHEHRKRGQSAAIQRGGMRAGLSNAASGTAASNEHPRPSRKTAVQIREDPVLYEFDQFVASDVGSNFDEDEYRIVELPPSIHLTHSSKDLEARAHSYPFKRVASQACGIFWHWHDRASIAHARHEDQHNSAAAHDRNVLQQQAFDQWRAACQARKHEHETEKFFADLGKRADSARDLFLLSKAFTHWAQCTSDEILRTSAARRHILRTHYFNAWRDITVVNELKVRRQGLSKFVGIWRRKGAHVANLQDDATNFRDNHLAANTYRDWFWGFCDRRAPGWYATKLKIKFFDKWRQLTHGLIIRGAWSTDLAHLHLIKKVVALCTARLQDARRLHEDADDFRRRSLANAAFTSLQKAVNFAHRRRDVELQVASRIAKSALADWSLKTRLSKSAAQINDLRMMRNAWTAWNDGLRFQILSSSINDRIVIQALYRWVIAERLALCERVRRGNVKARLLRSWRTRTDAVCTDLGRAEHWVTALRKRRATARVLDIWKAQAHQNAEDARRAHLFRSHQLARISVRVWADRARHVSEMQDQAAWSRFFILGTKTLKQWGEALVSTKKARRREAYATIRRSQKKKSARNLLLKWRGMAASIRELQDQAHHIFEQRLVAIQTTVLYQWHQRSLDCANMEQEAYALDRRNLLIIQLLTISGRHEAVQSLHHTAIEHLTETTDIAARKALHKINFQIFKIKRQRETAESFDASIRRKHQRLMLKHWCERSKRPSSQAKALFSQTVQEPPNFLDDDDEDAVDAAQLQGTTAAASTLEHGEASFEEFAASSVRPRLLMAGQTPAYLKTPSRRAEAKSGRSRIPLGITTPQTSQITPFMSRMRALYPGGLPKSARPDFGGRLGGASRVEEIEEESPAGQARK